MTVAMQIANHCSPALTGIKPANLISYSSADCCSIATYINYLAGRLGKMEIFFRLLQQKNGRDICLVFRKKILSKHLSNQAIKVELAQLGYPTDEDLSSMLDYLAWRFEHSEFPHEIAYFLGYPIADVKGFIANKGRNYCFNGYWKVYAEPDRAKIKFQQYTMCREAVLRRISRGVGLEELFG